MSEVASLQRLCTGKITSEIWKNRVSKQTFVDNNYKLKQPEFPDYIKYKYIEICESLSGEIMDLSLPEKIKIRLCAALLNVQRDAKNCSLDIYNLLTDKRIENMIYILNNLHFTAIGRVDYFKTVMACLIDSSGNLEIDYERLNASCYFSNKEKVAEFIKNYKYTKNKNVEEIIKKVGVNPGFVLPTSEKFMRLCDTNCYMNIEYVFDVYRDLVTPEFSCRLLIDKIGLHYYNEVRQTYDKKTNYDIRFQIITVYETLNHDTRINFIKQYGNKFVIIFLMTEQIDYCIHFYKNVCSYAPQFCLEILEKAFEEVPYIKFEYGEDVFKKLNKEAFINIWFNTSAEIKNRFIRSSVSIENLVIRLDDYDLVCTILNDPDISGYQSCLVDFIIFYCQTFPRKNPVLLDKISKDFREGKKYFKIHNIKKILEVQFPFHEKMIQNKSILSDKDMVELKTLIKEDENFIKNILKNVSENYFNNINMLKMIRGEYFFPFSLIGQINDIFELKFEDRASELLKYITEVFIYEDVFSFVMNLKKEFMERHGCIEYKYILLLYEDETVQTAILQMIKKSNFLNEYLPSIVQVTEPGEYFFEDLLTYDERREEVKRYLLSEEGLRNVIKKFVHTGNSYKKPEIQKIDEMRFFKTNWLYRYDILAEFVNYMLTNSKEVYQKHFKGPKVENLLPNQSLKDHKFQVNLSYEHFICILTGRQFHNRSFRTNVRLGKDLIID